LFQRLADGHDRLQAILNSTRDGMLMIDTTGRMVVANPIIGEIFGMSPDQLTGRRLVEVIGELPGRPSVSQAALLEAIYQALDEIAEQSAQITKRLIEVAAPRRIIERVSVPMSDTSGASMGRLLVLHDITEEKQAEELREDLTEMIVHDLRVPLTSILGTLQLLEEMVADRLDERRVVTMAYSGGMRLLDLVSSLLDIRRLEAGRMPLNRQPVLCEWLAQVARERMEALAARAGVTLRLDVPPNLPQVEADSDVIVRVLVNLLDNAIRFSRQGTSVQVSVLPADGQAGVEYRVCDTGPGILPEYHERIFQKFFQISGPRGWRGTGLGLAFSRLAVEAHGGRIWVENNPGGGSTFAFTLPVANGERRAWNIE
jgi:PAS domain S-box-containing protein